jgi:hypothetical protein
MCVEMFRQAMAINLFGNQLFHPFGGGATRLAAGRPTGVLAQSHRGLGTGNLLRYLQEGDARFALREWSPAWYDVTLDKIWDTNLLENGFAILLMLCGGCKPELIQCLAALTRAEFIEMMKTSPHRKWEMKNRTKVQTEGKYASCGSFGGDSDGRGARSENWNDGSNLDPESPGVREWEAALKKTALANCTAKVESVRSNFKDCGIGKGVIF